MPNARGRERRPLARLAWAIVVLLAIGAAALLGRLLSPELAAPQVARPSVTLPDGSSLFMFEQGLAISRDGTRIAYRAQPGQMLYIRGVDSDAAIPVRGSELSESPFFPPDGQWLAFFSGAKLRKVPVTGGAPLVICNVVSTGRGGTWGPDDTIIFATVGRASRWQRTATSVRCHAGKRNGGTILTRQPLDRVSVE